MELWLPFQICVKAISTMPSNVTLNISCVKLQPNTSEHIEMLKPDIIDTRTKVWITSNKTGWMQLMCSSEENFLTLKLCAVISCLLNIQLSFIFLSISLEYTFHSPNHMPIGNESLSWKLTWGSVTVRFANNLFSIMLRLSTLHMMCVTREWSPQRSWCGYLLRHSTGGGLITWIDTVAIKALCACSFFG